jgi:hypothetical protein
VPSRQQLELEGRVEALRGGVVESRADPAHRLDRAERTAGLGEHVTDVLAALVGVETWSVLWEAMNDATVIALPP